VKLNDAFGAQIEAHALEGVGMEGEFGGVGHGLADLLDAGRGVLEEQVHEFAQHADTVGGGMSRSSAMIAWSRS